MSNSRSAIVFGPGYATHDSGNFRFAEGGLVAEFMKDGRNVSLDEFGDRQKVVTNKMVKVTAQLWAGWENVSKVFKSSFLNPTRGSSLYGGTDKPLVANGRNGDRLTLHNFAWWNIPELFLGVDGELFGGVFEGYGLIRDTYDPEDANAYHTWATGQSYSAPAFSMANFKAPRMSATWGSVDGFSAFEARKGWRVRMTPEYEPDDLGMVDGRGLVDKFIKQLRIEATCDPLGVTEAQIQAALGFGGALGGLESANADTLTITGGSISVALAGMFIAQKQTAFNNRQTRAGDVTWENTTIFSTGTPVAAAVVS